MGGREGGESSIPGKETPRASGSEGGRGLTPSASHITLTPQHLS